MRRRPPRDVNGRRHGGRDPYKTTELKVRDASWWVFGWADLAVPVGAVRKVRRSLAGNPFPACEGCLTSWSTPRRSGVSELDQFGRMLGLNLAGCHRRSGRRSVLISTAALKELATAIPAATHNTI
jgi:hypothetical protein